jgi:hypothetical protein
MRFKPPAILGNLFSVFSRRSEEVPVTLKVVSSVMLSQKDRLWVLEVGESWIVVGSGTNGLTTLAQLQKGGLPLNQNGALPPFDLSLLQATSAFNGRDRMAAPAAPADVGAATTPHEVSFTAAAGSAEPVSPPPTSTNVATPEVESVPQERSDVLAIAPEFPLEPAAPEVAEEQVDESVPATPLDDGEAIVLPIDWLFGTPRVNASDFMVDLPEEFLLDEPVAATSAAEPVIVVDDVLPVADELTSDTPVLADAVAVVADQASAELTISAQEGTEAIVADPVAGESNDDFPSAPVADDDPMRAMRDVVARFAGEMSQMEGEHAANVATDSPHDGIASVSVRPEVEIDANGFPDPVVVAEIEMVEMNLQLAAEAGEQPEIIVAEAVETLQPIAKPDRQDVELSVGVAQSLAEQKDDEPVAPTTFATLYKQVRTNGH